MQSVIVKAPPAPSVHLTTVSLRRGGYLASHTCVCGLRPRAVRSAFHGRQHKVMRRRPSDRGAPRSLSCLHSFSFSHCPALSSRQGGTAVQLGQTPHQFTPTVKKIHLQAASGIWWNSCLVLDINSNWMVLYCRLRSILVITVTNNSVDLFILNKCKGVTWDSGTWNYVVELHILPSFQPYN